MVNMFGFMFFDLFQLDFQCLIFLLLNAVSSCSFSQIVKLSVGFHRKFCDPAD